MKKVIVFTIVTVLGISSMFITGCSNMGRGKEIEFVPTVGERYQNQSDIEGQWGACLGTTPDGQYGIGDPFVMRYNGKYYMYPSTANLFNGVKVFESEDMVNWEYKGLALSDEDVTSNGAYAPEVIYHNGYFYMCQSRGGNGHYIYRSESPTEGFTLYSKTDGMDESDINFGNLKMGIDGAFHLTDSGKLYLLHTSTPAGLKYNEIEDIDDISPKTIGKTNVLGTANLNHWIEGPGIFRRGEYSYLTYTGNHVISKGYRIAYSYAKNLGDDLSQFIQPRENVTLISTTDDHYGLGHSSNVTGPDLDSIYTAYHSLVGSGPARRYNLDRYLAWGGLLNANGVNIRPVAMPSRPTMEERDSTKLIETNEMFALGKTDDYFTAEYNFNPTSGQKLFFGEGYSIEFTSNKIELKKSGNTLLVKQIEYPQDKLCCVRVEKGDGIGYVYFNSMRIFTFDAQGGGGEIGYHTPSNVGYTSFTNDVFGTSDFEAVKNLSTRFPAITYLKGENRGFSIKNAEQVKGGVRVGEKQHVLVTENDEYAVILDKKGDWIKYGVDVGQTENHSFAVRVANSSKAKIKVTIGDTSKEFEIPDCAEPTNFALGNIDLTQGVTTMKVELVSGKASFVWFDLREDDTSEYEQSMSAFKRLNGSVVEENGELILTSTSATNDDAVAVWGSDGLSNFKISIEFEVLEDDCNFGLMVRANDYSYYKDQPAQSWRGYYIQFHNQMVAMDRYDYSSGLIDAVFYDNLQKGVKHKATVTAKGNEIALSIDDREVMSITDNDAFVYGKFGLYVTNGTMKVSVLDFKYL